MGLCWWFVKNQGIVKEIPAAVVDKGCKFWTEETLDFDEIKKLLKVPKPEPTNEPSA